jgi:hypothetical protein
VRDILNIMHYMPSTLNDIGISARTAETAKLATWKVMLQDWRDVCPHTTLWTADRNEHARELATQQQDFNENPFSDEHLQIRWAMMAKLELQEDTTDEGASKVLHDLSWIDLTEPDPKHNSATMRNERLPPIWKEQGNEMTGLFGRSCLKKVKQIELPMSTRVISSCFHYKIKRHSAGEHKLKVKRLKVRLVVQGQHMSKDKGYFIVAFSPVPHLSGLRCCMSMATAMKLKDVGVDLTQGFIQAESTKDAKAFYISPTPGYVEEPELCGLSGLQASIWHAVFWQVSARHMVQLAREPGLPEGRIRGCYVEQKGQGCRHYPCGNTRRRQHCNGPQRAFTEKLMMMMSFICSCRNKK